ncbi:MAG: hypothetical protein M0Z25_09765 [Nitrospiraceae bacterium]|nr:hypothetical protein [Nitrospiraceae bacterium]
MAKRNQSLVPRDQNMSGGAHRVPSPWVRARRPHRGSRRNVFPEARSVAY